MKEKKQKRRKALIDEDTTEQAVDLDAIVQESPPNEPQTASEVKPVAIYQTPPDSPEIIRARKQSHQLKLRRS